MSKQLKITSPSLRRNNPDLHKRHTTKSQRTRRRQTRSGDYGAGLMQTVKGGNFTADEVVFLNLSKWRQDARKLSFSDYPKNYLTMLLTNVIGRGIVAQSQIMDYDNKPDHPARKAVEMAFKNWQKKADSEGNLNFREICTTVLRSVAIDGEALIRKRRKGPDCFQLELIDSNLLDVTYHTDLKNGNYIKFGIEYNSENEKVAYHINESVRTSLGGDYARADRIRIPADEIIHLYVNEMVKQKRGFPWISTCAERIKMLEGYEKAALVAARVGAAKMGFLTSETGDEYDGDEEDDKGNIISEVAPGMLEELPKGMKFEKFDPDYPKGEFQPFIKANLRGVAAGLAVSYNRLANDLEGVNFSSMRHGVIEDREVWMIIQQWFQEKFVDVVFEEWLTMQYKLRKIKIYAKGGKEIPLQYPLEYYLPIKFQFRRWAWIDPIKEIMAKAKEIELGVTTISEVIMEMGKDPEETFIRRAQEKKRIQEIEEEYGVELFPQKQPKQAQSDSNNNKEPAKE